MLMEKRGKVEENVVNPENLAVVADVKGREMFDSTFGKKERDRHYL